jgi:glycosyltransferase involved in cell wall biosynthesis
MVSCLMATTGERETIGHALECYRRQVYPNRELVIVTHPEGLQNVTEIVRRSGAANVVVHSVGREMTLGDCRNLSIARSRGDIVMQWDDDDLYDPLRISVAVQLLAQSDASAVLLSRVVLWWPQRELAAISERRCWEGSVAVWREHAPVYPSLARGEDTFAMECLAGTRTVALYDLPLLYVYTVHARNTWDTRHFEETFERAERVFRGKQYRALVGLLSKRAPMLEYQADLAAAASTATVAETSAGGLLEPAG